MALPIQNLRSSTANKRPVATGLSVGQIAINYNEEDPAIYLRGSSDSLVKVGPIYVGSGAPNAVPASGGASGNTVGEPWLDISTSPASYKVWNGSSWNESYTLGSGSTIGSGSTLISPVFSGSVTIDNLTLTGTPVAPTAASGDSSTQVATTAFVNNEIANDAALKDGTGATGTWNISVTGNAGTATALQTARTIQGVNFDGTANITVAAPGSGIAITGVTISNAGVLSVNSNTGNITNVVFDDLNQTFTKAQRGAVVALAGSGVVTPDFSAANNFTMTLSGSVTLAFPSGVASGQSGAIRIEQGNNYVISYSGNWEFPGSTPPNNTTTSGAADLLAYYAHSDTAITAQLLTNVG